MPNKVYRAVESAVTFTTSGGTVVLTLDSLAFGSGRVSARHDRGAGSQSGLHEVKIIVQAASTGFVVGEAIEVYLFQSDGTYMDGTLGTSDAVMAADKRRNGMLIGVLIADTTSDSVNIATTFQDVPISSRYYSIGVWNASAARGFLATTNTSRVIVTPTPPEIQ